MRVFFHRTYFCLGRGGMPSPLATRIFLSVRTCFCDQSSLLRFFICIFCAQEKSRHFHAFSFFFVKETVPVAVTIEECVFWNARCVFNVVFEPYNCTFSSKLIHPKGQGKYSMVANVFFTHSKTTSQYSVGFFERRSLV